MKILDPQAAVLTNSEVLNFMSAHPPRNPDPRVGGYPVTDLRGFWSVQKEFTEYANTITPYLSHYPDPPSKYMELLLHKLRRFHLTKAELLMIINLGVGVHKNLDAKEGVIETSEKVDRDEGDLLDRVERHIISTEGIGDGQLDTTEKAFEDTQMKSELEADSDMPLLNVIIEEMDERFNDEQVDELLRICREVLTRKEDIRAQTDGSAD